jgi:signal transduction histidine kinase
VSVRLRFALLYSGAFLVTGLLVLAIAYGSVMQVQHVGGGPVRTSRPELSTNVSTLDVVIALVVLAVLSVGLGWLLATRLLRPVRVITSTAQDISVSNLSRRLPPGRRDDEFNRLGETLNDLFGRLEDAFAAQRRFVANASHELRTPLTAERTLLQVALADPDASAATLREACEQVLELGAGTERLIDGLLTLATGERGLERREPLDLATIAGRVAGREAFDVDLALEVAPVAGDPRLVESLIANLVGNAVRYNVPGGWVRVRTGGSSVRVSNTGRLVPADQLDRLFQPFQRMSGARTGGGSGYGLGLAIVRAIADAHDATIVATARPEGGLDIEVTFPA